MKRHENLKIPQKEPKKVSFLPELENLEDLEEAFKDRPGTPMPNKPKRKTRNTYPS